MNEIPEVPVPPPEVSKGKLWTSLAGPPVITVAANSLIGFASRHGGGSYGIEFLYVLPIGLLAILICQVIFIRAMKVRFRGRSMALTGIGFFLGQLVVCLALWFGSCVLFIH